MIPGSRPYKSKTESTEQKNSRQSAAENSVSAANIDDKIANPQNQTKPESAGAPMPESDFNPMRRELFESIVPKFGQGLVKLLRTSNHLKHEISDAWRTRK